MEFKTPYLYDFVTKLCREQATVIIMKMSIFASLAKAKLNTESIKGSNLVAVRHTIDHFSRQWPYP
jgi:hypothetical protein